MEPPASVPSASGSRPSATAAALQLLAPPVAALLGWALLGEVLGWTDVAGGMVTLSGLALLFRARAG